MKGVTQDRLDGLTGVQVDIIVMEGSRGGPHLELLSYRSPKSQRRAVEFEPNSIPATRLLVDYPNSGSQRRPPTLPDATAQTGHTLLLIDPDGHRVELCA